MASAKRKKPSSKAEPRSRAQGPKDRTARYVWVIVGAATLLRFWSLTTHAPVLTDEAIYMRWAEIIEHQGEWFISLLDGKQPLSYWIYAVLRMNIGGDPLFAARGVSAVGGGLSAGLLFLIARRIAGPVAGFASALLWALFPWSMIYDRMIYAEALVNLLGMAIVYTAIRCFQAEFTWKWTGACALALAAAFLVKSTALLFVPCVAGLALICRRRPWSALAVRLAVILGAVVAAMLLMVLATPEAPTAETHSTVLHHSSRFATITGLASSLPRAE